MVDLDSGSREKLEQDFGKKGSGKKSTVKRGAVKSGPQAIIWRWCFYFMLCTVMVLALLPTSGTPGFPGQDKLMHLMVFSGLFFTGAKGYPSLVSWKWLYLYLGLFAYGVIMEFLQGQTSYRSMEAWDLVADSLGLIVGHSALVFFSKYKVSTS